MADLRIAGLTKAFGDGPILRGIDLSVPSGALFAVLGASGSGKTTLLRLLSGFERVDDGTIEIDGHIVSGPRVHLPPDKRRVGYVSQDGTLFPHLSVAENVVFGLPRNERHLAKAEALLEKVGLSARYAQRGPHELSGGEQQRVALARALAPAPKLVLLDEPFSALDAALRIETRDAVVSALAAVGTTALLVTHDQSEALSLGHQIAVLRHGLVAQAAPPETLYRQPIDPELAKFVGEAVLLPGTVVDGFVSCALGRLPLRISTRDGVADVLVRPEQIRVSTETAGPGTFGKVLAVTYYGHDARVVVSLEPDTLQIATRVVGHGIPPVGSRVRLEVDGYVMAYSSSPPVIGSKTSTPSVAVLSALSSRDLPEADLCNAAKL